MNDTASNFENVIQWGLLAGFGGAVKYVSAVIRGNEVVTNRRFLALLFANIFISSFCGLMGGLVITTITADPTWAYLACGLFGYLGTQGLDILILALKKKVTPISTVIPIPPHVPPHVD